MEPARLYFSRPSKSRRIDAAFLQFESAATALERSLCAARERVHGRAKGPDTSFAVAPSYCSSKPRTRVPSQRDGKENGSVAQRIEEVMRVVQRATKTHATVSGNCAEENDVDKDLRRAMIQPEEDRRFDAVELVFKKIISIDTRFGSALDEIKRVYDSRIAKYQADAKRRESEDVRKREPVPKPAEINSGTVGQRQKKAAVPKLDLSRIHSRYEGERMVFVEVKPKTEKADPDLH